MTIKIFFGTNRNVKKRNQDQQPIDFGGKINGYKPFLNFGKAIVSDNLRKVKEVHTSKNLSPEKLCCSHEIFNEIQDRMYKGIDTILFFHGSNNAFNDSLIEAAKLKLIYEEAGECEYTMIIFSWPSEGNILSYKSDRQDARESSEILGSGIYELSRFLMELCWLKLIQKASDIGENDNLKEKYERSDCGRLHIMAHSMGAYVLRHALQELRTITGERIPQLFDEILLIAADEDEDSFEQRHKLKFLPEFARRVSVYFNREDVPLMLSDWFMDNMNRLGSDGPPHPYALPDNVTLVNCRYVVDGFFEHHYHKTEPAVIRDISYVLNGWRSEDIPGRDYSEQTNSYDLVDPEKVDQIETSDLTIS